MAELMTHPPPYVDMATLCELLPWGKSTIADMMKRGLLPPGKQIGGKLVWKWSTVAEKMDAILGEQPTEAELAERVRHATRRAVNG